MMITSRIFFAGTAVLLRSTKVLKVSNARFISAKLFTKSYHKHSSGKIASKIGVILGGGFALALAVYKNSVFSEEKARKRKRIVILGSGWAAVSLLKNLKPDLYDVAVVSPSNYFLFTPFLPSATVGTVETRSIVEPVRRILTNTHHGQVRFLEAECISVNRQDKKVVCRDTSAVTGENPQFELVYDYLVVAVGSETQTYNIPGVKEHTHFLKDIYDVQKIRSNILDCLETAGCPDQRVEAVKQLLHFVVVGGGPTGVEFAAELHDFLSKELQKQYSHVIDHMKITLLGGHKLLCAFDEEISRYVEGKFARDEINVDHSRVIGVTKDSIQVKDKGSNVTRSLPFGMCVWAAGIAPRAVTKALIETIPTQNNRNALVTNNFLQVLGTADMFAIGDCATVELKQLEKNVDELFAKADVNQDGSLSVEEFGAVMKEAMEKYPHLLLHLKKAHRESLKGAFDEIDTDKDQKLSINEFRQFLHQVDCELTSLPASAQVAAQQGKYLGHLLSQYHENLEKPGDAVDFDKVGALPFHYRHLGSFAYIGDDRAVLTLPIIGSFKGLGTMWLWRATYTSECVGWRMKVMIMFDWIKTSLFGRDTSRI